MEHADGCRDAYRGGSINGVVENIIVTGAAQDLYVLGIQSQGMPCKQRKITMP
jgi:hypothetical protein